MIVDSHLHLVGRPMPALARAACSDGCFPVARLLALMDAHGVGRAVLLQNPTIGTMNFEVAAAIDRHPDRFVGRIQVDPLAPDAAAIIRT
ncbi:MAG: amidohydrolase family protein [Kiritimatiellae bacterium]|nr:amidohydrolase family protein [Kiritimatiellia bacterium]